MEPVKKDCVLGGKGTFPELVEEGMTGACFAASAVCVNALVLYLMGIEDITPGVINGGISGFAPFIVHRLRHALTDSKVVKEWKCDDRLKNMLTQLVLSVGASAALLKYHGYPLKKWEIARMQTDSILAMVGTSKYYLNVPEQA